MVADRVGDLVAALGDRQVRVSDREQGGAPGLPSREAIR